MKRATEAKLRKWHRQAKALDERARRLMDEMSGVFGFDGDSTDPIDNVLCATEELCSVLSRPDLDMWKIAPTVPNGERQ